MDNAMMAGPGAQVAGRPGRARVALALAGVALLVAVLFLFQRPASAQVGFPSVNALACAILNALAAAIAFLRPFLSAIAAAFGCVISG